MATLREEYNKRRVVLSSLASYKLGAEGGKWMDVVSVDDAINCGYAVYTRKGSRDNLRQIQRL